MVGSPVMPATFFINLDRRPDRLEQFRLRCSEVGLEAERFSAVDSLRTVAPSRWRGENSAHYSCLLSHVEVLTEALRRGLTEVIVMEDDCVFAGDFRERLAAFLAAVPQGWDAIMLGGRHRTPVEMVGDGVARVHWTDGCHAYWMRGGECIRSLRDLWASSVTDTDVAWRSWQQEHSVFSPVPFLCGQAAGTSDISADRCWKQDWWGTE